MEKKELKEEIEENKVGKVPRPDTSLYRPTMDNQRNEVCHHQIIFQCDFWQNLIGPHKRHESVQSKDPINSY